MVTPLLFPAKFIPPPNVFAGVVLANPSSTIFPVAPNPELSSLRVVPLSPTKYSAFCDLPLAGVKESVPSSTLMNPEDAPSDAASARFTLPVRVCVPDPVFIRDKSVLLPEPLAACIPPAYVKELLDAAA